MANLKKIIIRNNGILCPSKTGLNEAFIEIDTEKEYDLISINEPKLTLKRLFETNYSNRYKKNRNQWDEHSVDTWLNLRLHIKRIILKIDLLMGAFPLSYNSLTEYFYLSMQSNRCFDLSTLLEHLPQIKYFIINNCPRLEILKIPVNNDEWKSMEILKINNTLIQCIDSDIFSYPVRILNLADNKIQSLSYSRNTKSNKNCIKKLILNNNPLRQLPVDFLIENKQLAELHIRNCGIDIPLIEDTIRQLGLKTKLIY